MNEQQLMQLNGKRVRVACNDLSAICNVHFDDCTNLTENETVGILKVLMYPAGPIALLRTDDGQQIAFDGGLDVEHERIVITPEE